MNITYDATKSAPSLNKSVQPRLDQILSGEFLGASRNIRQINDLFCAITETWETSSSKLLIETLLATGDFLIATRGRNTPAIANAVSYFLREINWTQDITVDDIRRLVASRRTEYNAQSLNNAKIIAQFGANLLIDCDTILVHDYSSSMIAILKRLSDLGQQKRLIVTESRALNGGRPIVQEAAAMGHSICYIIDMAFSHFLPEIDAVLIGSERILANGDCWNTVGSYPIAILAHQRQIPFYVATEMIKIDPESILGVRKPIKHHDYSGVLSFPATNEYPESISFIAPDLDNVPAPIISAYITPAGVILPEHIWYEAKRFLDSIGTYLSLPNTETQFR